MAQKYRKCLTRRSPDGLAVYDMEFAKRNIDLSEAPPIDMKEANLKPTEAVHKIIDVIHSVPGLFDDPQVKLDTLRLYIGRTGWEQANNRADFHWNNKGLPYFLPTMVVHRDKIQKIEGIGLNYLRFLSENDHLCFGELLNKTSAPGGAVSDEPWHIIYLSFGFDGKRIGGYLENEEMKPAAGALYYANRDKIPEEFGQLSNIEKTLKIIGNPREAQKLYWHNSSRDD